MTFLIAGAVLGWVCADAGNAFARGDSIPGSRYVSGRAAGMGDAFLPLADDGASGLFYNPAALGRIRYTQFEPLNFQIQANSQYLRAFDTNFYKVTSLGGYRPTLQANPGSFPGVSGAIFPNFYVRGLAFGVLTQTRFAATEDAASGTIRYRSKYQLIPTFGGALRLASGVIRLGYSLQWIHEASGDVTVPNTADPLGYNEGLARGSALSHNLGFALTFPVEYLPAVNLVARNVLGAKYKSFSLVSSMTANPSGLPPDEPMTVDASFSIQPKIGNGAQLNYVLELRDGTNRSGFSVMKRLATGLEFTFRDLFFVRGGWGSGYPSAGFGLRRRTAEFSVAWFSEELGSPSYKERDTRFILHYQIRAF